MYSDKFRTLSHFALGFIMFLKIVVPQSHRLGVQLCKFSAGVNQIHSDKLFEFLTITRIRFVNLNV